VQPGRIFRITRTRTPRQKPDQVRDLVCKQAAPPLMKLNFIGRYFRTTDTSTDDASDHDTDESGDAEDVPITASNFAARSRALDTRAAREAQLDAEELQMAATGRS